MKHGETPQTTAPTAAALTEANAARYIGMSRPFLRRSRRAGGGPSFVRVGRSIRYLLKDLDAWLSAHRVDVSNWGR